MTIFSVSTSMLVTRNTAPFLAYRALICIGIAFVWVLATGLGAGIGWGVAAVSGTEFPQTAIFRGGALGFLSIGGGLIFLRRKLFFYVRAGHIVVMIRFLEGGGIPAGKAQIAYARGAVKDRFTGPDELKTLNRLITGAIRVITGPVQDGTTPTVLPVPGLNKLKPLMRGLHWLSVRLTAEMVLAQLVGGKPESPSPENPWKDGRKTLVHYAENARTISDNAVLITLVSYILAFCVFVLILIPAGALMSIFPTDQAAGSVAFALVFSWAIKSALIDPFALACLLQVYFSLTDGRKPDDTWAAKLEKTSPQYRVLGENALKWVAKTPLDSTAVTGLLQSEEKTRA